MRPYHKLTLLALFALLVTAAAPASVEAQSSCYVDITGPSNVYAETSCVTPSWSLIHCAVDCPYGVHYSWYKDGSYVGSGATYSETFCPQSPATTYTMNLSVYLRCGRTPLGSDSQSVFVSLCENRWGTPYCLG